MIAQDAISSIKTVHAFGAQEKLINRYDEYLKEAHKEGKKNSLIFAVLFSNQTFFVMSGTALGKPSNLSKPSCCTQIPLT